MLDIFSFLFFFFEISDPGSVTLTQLCDSIHAGTRSSFFLHKGRKYGNKISGKTEQWKIG